MELELERTVRSNILEPVDVSEWATYIVPAIKKMAPFKYVEITK